VAKKIFKLQSFALFVLDKSWVFVIGREILAVTFFEREFELCMISGSGCFPSIAIVFGDVGERRFVYVLFLFF
jgi:hypothetical protein